MQALWLWVLEAATSVCLALGMTWQSSTMQRVTNLISGWADKIAMRCPALMQAAFIAARDAGRMITSYRPLAELAVEEEWPVIRSYLLSVNVDAMTVDKLKQELITVVELRIFSEQLSIQPWW